MNVIFSPYCNFATMGFSEMKLNKMSTVSPNHVNFPGSTEGTYVNTRLLRENGIGMMRNMNSAISAIRSMNTCGLEAVSAAIGHQDRTLTPSRGRQASRPRTRV